MTRLFFTDLATFALFVAHCVYVVRAVIRPNREPAARLAWVMVIVLVPVGGIVAYWLLGEMYLGKRRRQRLEHLEATLPRPFGWPRTGAGLAEDRYAPPFQLTRQFNGLASTTGNAVEVLAQHPEILEQLVADIDAARATVHICFYIWLADHTGTRLTQALQRAAGRGVAVRVIADGVGSRAFISSPLWRAMRESGVALKVALKVTNPIGHVLYRRLDLRNHRKSVIVDNHIAWFGSMNAADPEFRIKPDFAPWIDLMVRCTGPVAQQAQHLFALDWMSEQGDDLTALLVKPSPEPAGGVLLQVAGTGPTAPFAAMSECFATLIHAAAREVIITTPYFVPDDPLLSALVTCARRGAGVTLILPERNDSWLVTGASRSSYATLLDAGVGLHHFPDGLLHAKSITVDGELALVGSANMDRRSLDLNFENNLLLRDSAIVAQIRDQQQAWLARSRMVTRAEVAAWGIRKRLWHNLLAMLSPIL
jgi:cardiolipin synthase A/B